MVVDLLSSVEKVVAVIKFVLQMIETYKSNNEDLFEYTTTLNTLMKILQQASRDNVIDLTILDDIGKGVVLFKDEFEKIASRSKLEKFIFANGNRKKLNSISSVLQNRIGLLNTVFTVRPDESLNSLRRFKDAEGKSFWKEHFGKDCYQVEMSIFLNAYNVWLRESSGSFLNDAQKSDLKKIFDFDNTESVNVYKLSTFLECFGPFSAALKNIEEIHRYEWFHGHSSEVDTTSLLSKEPVGSFLVRFESVELLFPVLSYKSEKGVNHFVFFKENEKFSIKLSDGASTVLETGPSIETVIRNLMYKKILAFPSNQSTKELTQHPAFFGTYDSESTIELLSHSTPCSYLIRLSHSQPGSIVIAYKNLEGKIDQVIVTILSGNYTLDGQLFTTIPQLLNAIDPNLKYPCKIEASSTFNIDQGESIYLHTTPSIEKLKVSEEIALPSNSSTYHFKALTTLIFDLKAEMQWSDFESSVCKLFGVKDCSPLKKFLSPQSLKINSADLSKFMQWFSPVTGEKSQLVAWKFSQIIDLVSQKWFAGLISSSQAQQLLKDQAPGTFLMRFSGEAPHFVLSVFSSGVLEYKIRNNNPPFGYELYGSSFSNPKQIVEKYSKELLKDGAAHFLNKPCPLKF